MELTPDLVLSLVDRLFPPGERSAALALLERYGGAPHEREPLRVRVAALKVSGGQLAELERAIAHAGMDYRDVLAWAEYPGALTKPTWEMPAAEAERVRAADRAQYLAWLAEHAQP